VNDQPAIVRAADELAAALGEIREIDGYPRGGGLDDLWPTFARENLARWGADLRRAAQRAVDARAEASAEPLSDDSVDAIERATWRLAGTRDKLRAIISLALGVPALRLDRPGVRFAPDHRKIARRLEEVGNADALRLRDLFDQIAELPAIDLRNQISHSLSPVPEAAEVCWIDIAILDAQNGIIAWDTSTRLFAENVLDQGSLDPQTLYDFAIGAVDDALALLGEGISVASAVVRAHGKLHQPYAVFKREDGTLYLERPPGLGPASRALRGEE
jgi:hypothetical protein